MANLKTTTPNASSSLSVSDSSLYVAIKRQGEEAFHHFLSLLPIEVQISVLSKRVSTVVDEDINLVVYINSVQSLPIFRYGKNRKGEYCSLVYFSNLMKVS